MFFVLSGFLIMKTLLDHRNVIDFIIRRAFRIVPLYLVYLTIGGLMTGQSYEFYKIFYLYIENYNMDMISGDPTSYKLFAHLWSFCVEMHFYLGIALWMALTRFQRCVDCSRSSGRDYGRETLRHRHDASASFLDPMASRCNSRRRHGRPDLFRKIAGADRA